MVETTNAELGGTLQSAIIADLPMNGRNFANLIQLRPGVTIYPGGSGWTQSSNGMRATDNVYLFEGVNGNDPWMSQPIISAVMGSGDAGTLISIDAIDEFKTEENPRAEYGWKPGAIVNVGIKSGTNAMHGTRLTPTAATALGMPTTSSTMPRVRQPHAGGTGAVRRHLWRAHQERQALLFPELSRTNGTLSARRARLTPPSPRPASEMPQHNLIAACNAALAVGAVGSGTPGALTHLSASLAGLSDTCAPLGNYPGIFPANPGTASLGSIFIPNTLPNTNRIDSGLGKVDYHLNDKNSLNFMYEISPGSGQLNDAPVSKPIQPSRPTNTRALRFSPAGWTWTPNSTWVNEARVGYSHYYPAVP